MPTTLARHTLTETPELARALNDADARWPELHGDRPALLRKLVEAGWQVVAVSLHDIADVRQRALRSAAGAATGAYPTSAASALAAEWPE